MKKKIIALSMVALLFVAAGCGCKKKTNTPSDNNTQGTANTSSDVVKEQVVDNVKFSNVMMLVNNKQTAFTCDMENQGKESVVADYLVIHALDANGKELSKLIVTLGELEAGKTKQVSVSNDTDLTAAKSVTYEFVNSPS